MCHLHFVSTILQTDNIYFVEQNSAQRIAAIQIFTKVISFLVSFLLGTGGWRGLVEVRSRIKCLSNLDSVHVSTQIQTFVGLEHQERKRVSLLP